jgi:ferric-dicitrate binding protein FerR (iron transport regulator)
MEKLIPVELLEKYINGGCTEDEIALVKNWYQSFEYDHDYVSDISFAEEKELEERIYSRILNQIDAIHEEKITPKKSTYSIFKKWYTLAGAAASILFVTVITLLELKKVKTTLTADSGLQQMVSVTNNSRQIYKSTLSDNSSVWLYPHSKLTYPKTFAVKSRNVSISGECFFEVSKNHESPFIISSRSIITKVWGTSFLVNDNEQLNSAEVSVLTGKVSVSIKNACNSEHASSKLEKDEVMIYPHQKIIYLIDQHIFKPETMVEEPALQIYKRINLSFDNKPLSEIIPVLDTMFHVHIKVTHEKLNRYILNADLTGFNLPEVLEALKKSLNVSYQIKSNNIELE